MNDGCYVTETKILATQRKLRFHPGLNVREFFNFHFARNFNQNNRNFQVGFGKNGTLFALESGRVVVTCEEINPNWDHTWIQRIYAGREDQTIHKKYFNVMPMEQHNRFRLIDAV